MCTKPSSSEYVTAACTFNGTTYINDTAISTCTLTGPGEFVATSCVPGDGGYTTSLFNVLDTTTDAGSWLSFGVSFGTVYNTTGTIAAPEAYAGSDGFSEMMATQNYGGSLLFSVNSAQGLAAGSSGILVLHMAEVVYTAAGARLFTTKVGTVDDDDLYGTVTDFDLFVEFGYLVAGSISFPFYNTPLTGIQVTMVASADAAAVFGIELQIYEEPELGSDTVISACSEPGIGEFVAAACDAGDVATYSTYRYNVYDAVTDAGDWLSFGVAFGPNQYLLEGYVDPGAEYASIAGSAEMYQSTNQGALIQFPVTATHGLTAGSR